MKRIDVMSRSQARAWRTRWIPVVLAALVSGACATTGSVLRRQATPAPSVWSQSPPGTTTGSEDLARWWDRFGDAALSRVVEQSLAANTDMRAARARLRQARAQRNLAQADLKPSVKASWPATASKQSDQDGSVSASPGIDASWEIDIFGALKNAVAAAQADAAATAEDLHNTQVSLVAEVATNYVDLRSYQARLEIAQASLVSQRETLQITQWRAQAGLVSSVDVEQARSNAAQTEASIPTLQTGLTQAEHRLAVLAGLPPAGLRAELDPPAPVPAAPDRIAVAIPADALRQRSDVRAAERRIVAETARLARAKAARYPSFTLRGSLGTTMVTAVLTGGTSVAASVAASVAQTIWDGGRIRQQIEIQAATQEQAVISYEAAVLTALEDVENALVSIEQNRLRMAALNTAAEAARNAALLASQRYSAGIIDFQTVLDTQRSVLSSEDSLASAQANRTIAVIQLYKALGGGWSPADGGPASGSGSGTR
jgi:outer membrane protein, multidrug efflux system